MDFAGTLSVPYFSAYGVVFKRVILFLGGLYTQAPKSVSLWQVAKNKRYGICKQVQI